MYGMFSFDSAFWVSSVTNLVKCIFFLSVYSLIINCIFGHRSFWWTNSFKAVLQRYLCEYVFVDASITSTTTTTMTVVRNSMCIVDDDVILLILGYLTSSELSVTSCVCKGFQTSSDHPILWLKLYCLTLSTLPAYVDQSLNVQQPKCATILSDKFCHNDLSLRMMNKVWFYRLIDKCPGLILDGVQTHNSLSSTDHKLVVMIRGEVFDLTDFAHRHPGGIYILQEGMRGVGGGGERRNGVNRPGDATRLFEVANHSATALVESRKYVLWSPLRFVGRRGMPRAIWLTVRE
jgi:hypothetical protein